MKPLSLVLRYRPSWEVVTDAALMPPPVPLTLLVLRFVVDICGERGWFKTTGRPPDEKDILLSSEIFDGFSCKYNG